MAQKQRYFIVEASALPEIYLKVADAKRYLETGEEQTVNAATRRAGISRSSFYKYKEDIFPFRDQARGRALTFVIQMDDTPGILSGILGCVARFGGNILTIHQSIPINGIATLTLTVETPTGAADPEVMVEEVERQSGVHYLKILGRE